MINNKKNLPVIISLLFFHSVVYCGDDTPRQIESLVFTCYTCHGPEGKSPGKIPELAGTSSEKIKEKLNAFRQDLGEPTIMNRIARGYSEEEIVRIADYLAGLK